MSTLHLALIGDSIFDNAIYVPDGPAVIDHVRNLLPPPWQATLVAHDGDVVADVSGQIPNIPQEASHLVVSIGGNDALQSMEIMSLPASTVMFALGHLTEVRCQFQRSYRAMLCQLLELQRPTAVCTIYDAVPGLTPELQTALCIFNDTIVREAAFVQVPVIDLRMVCTESADYSEISPIEPSGEGGRKIAQAIARWIG
jgi:hypothetical protein